MQQEPAPLRCPLAPPREALRVLSRRTVLTVRCPRPHPIRVNVATRRAASGHAQPGVSYGRRVGGGERTSGREHDCVSCAAPIPRLAAFSATQMPTSARMDSEGREVGPSEGRQSRDCGTGALSPRPSRASPVPLRRGRQCVGKRGGLAARRAFLCAAQNLKTSSRSRRRAFALTRCPTAPRSRLHRHHRGHILARDACSNGRQRQTGSTRGFRRLWSESNRRGRRRAASLTGAILRDAGRKASQVPESFDIHSQT